MSWNMISLSLQQKDESWRGKSTSFKTGSTRESMIRTTRLLVMAWSQSKLSHEQNCQRKRAPSLSKETCGLQTFTSSWVIRVTWVTCSNANDQWHHHSKRTIVLSSVSRREKRVLSLWQGSLSRNLKSRVSNYAACPHGRMSAWKIKSSHRLLLKLLLPYHGVQWWINH